MYLFAQIFGSFSMVSCWFFLAAYKGDHSQLGYLLWIGNQTSDTLQQVEHHQFAVKKVKLQIAWNSKIGSILLSISPLEHTSDWKSKK